MEKLFQSQGQLKTNSVHIKSKTTVISTLTTYKMSVSVSYDGLLQYLSPRSPFRCLRFLILLLLFLFSLNLYLLLYICPIALLLRFCLRRERLYGAPLPSRVLFKNGAEFVNVDEGFPRVGLGPCEAAAQSVSKLHRRQEGRQGLRVSGL